MVPPGCIDGHDARVSGCFVRGRWREATAGKNQSCDNDNQDRYQFQSHIPPL